MATTNVWHVNRVAVVTIKIHAPVVLPVHLAPLALTGTTVPMAGKAKLDQSVPVKDTNIKQPPDANNARRVPKAPTDPLVQLDLLARKAVPAAKLEMANPADPVQLARLAALARQVVMANPVQKATMVPMPRLAAKDPLEVKETKDRPDPLAPMAIKEQQAKVAQLDQLDQPAIKARVATMVPKDPLARPALLEHPARTRNIVHALIVRKHKEPQHRINPNSILGQPAFDHDNPYFFNNLNLLVSITIFIHNWL